MGKEYMCITFNPLSNSYDLRMKFDKRFHEQDIRLCEEYGDVMVRRFSYDSNNAFKVIDACNAFKKRQIDAETLDMRLKGLID